ncbi:MAG: hypothetical protein AABX72_03705 [Nanoarchaeota archaeon]
MVDWKTVELNGDDIQDLLAKLRCGAYGDEDLLNASIEDYGGIDQIVDELFEIHKRDGLGTDNPLLALSRAVDFTKAVILAVADITLEIAESEPPEEVKLLLDQIRAKAAGQPVTRPTIDRFRGVPRTQDGQIIN